jgi:DNA polymerase III delta prime subunit
MPKKEKFNLGDEIIVIKNKDKDEKNWMEEWSKPVNRSPGHLPHPFRLLALGPPGKGKTNYAKLLFLKHQASSKPFERLVVVGCDLSSQEWIDTAPNMILDSLPPLSLFEDGIKTCLILDDYNQSKLKGDEMKTLTTLFRYTSTHKNLSIMCSYQSFFDCMSICRKTANVFILYKPTSKQETKTISNRIGLDANVLKNLFKEFCTEYHDMVMVDKTKKTPYPIRKNIYEIIDIESDSDSE